MNQAGIHAIDSAATSAEAVTPLPSASAADQDGLGFVRPAVLSAAYASGYVYSAPPEADLPESGSGGKRPRPERVVASPDSISDAARRLPAGSADERAAAQSAVSAATSDEPPAARPPNSGQPTRTPAMQDGPTGPFSDDGGHIRPPASGNELELTSIGQRGVSALSPPGSSGLSAFTATPNPTIRPPKASPPKQRPPKATPMNAWTVQSDGSLGVLAAGSGAGTSVGPGGTVGRFHGFGSRGTPFRGGGGGGRPTERPRGPDGSPSPDPGRPESPKWGSSRDRKRWGPVESAGDRVAATRSAAAAADARATAAYGAYQAAVAAGERPEVIKKLTDNLIAADQAATAASAAKREAESEYERLRPAADLAAEGSSAGQRERRRRRADREAAEDERRAAREAPEERRKQAKQDRAERRAHASILISGQRGQTPAQYDSFRRTLALGEAYRAGQSAAAAERASKAATAAVAEYRRSLSSLSRDEPRSRAAAGRFAQAVRAVAAATESAGRHAERTVRSLGSRGDAAANATAKSAAKEARTAAEAARKAADAVDRARRRADRSNTTANRIALNKAVAAAEALQKAAAEAAKRAKAAAEKAVLAAQTKRAKRKPAPTGGTNPTDTGPTSPPDPPPTPPRTSWRTTDPEPCETIDCSCEQAKLECPEGQVCRCQTVPAGTRPIPVKATVPESASISGGTPAARPPDDLPRGSGTTGPAPTPTGGAAISPPSHSSGSARAVFPKDARTDKQPPFGKVPPQTVANPNGVIAIGDVDTEDGPQIVNLPYASDSPVVVYPGATETQWPRITLAAYKDLSLFGWDVPDNPGEVLRARRMEEFNRRALDEALASDDTSWLEKWGIRIGRIVDIGATIREGILDQYDEEGRHRFSVDRALATGVRAAGQGTAAVATVATGGQGAAWMAGLTAPGVEKGVALVGTGIEAVGEEASNLSGSKAAGETVKLVAWMLAMGAAQKGVKTAGGKVLDVAIDRLALKPASPPGASAMALENMGKGLKAPPDTALPEAPPIPTAPLAATPTPFASRPVQPPGSSPQPAPPRPPSRVLLWWTETGALKCKCEIDPFGRGERSGRGEAPSARSAPLSDAKSIRSEMQGLREGTNPSRARLVSSEAELQALHDKWTAGGKPVAGSTRAGPYTELPDGTRIGLRPTSSAESGGGPTLDVFFPDGKYMRVHIK